jgi:hypothetical protein
LTRFLHFTRTGTRFARKRSNGKLCEATDLSRPAPSVSF